METYTVTVGDAKFPVPLRSVGSVRIAYLDFLCDLTLVRACVSELAKLLPDRPGAIVVPETGAIPLGFELAVALGRPFVVLRKGHRGYMGQAISVPVTSVAAAGPEALILESSYLATLRRNPVTLLDTVTSSGQTIRAMRKLMDISGVAVADTAVAFIEGTEAVSDVLSLGFLPVFPLTHGANQSEMTISRAV
jgi:adenine/guanine phosphoribosyltransferase-like PRPP-binding protein